MNWALRGERSQWGIWAFHFQEKMKTWNCVISQSLNTDNLKNVEVLCNVHRPPLRPREAVGHGLPIYSTSST